MVMDLKSVADGIVVGPKARGILGHGTQGQEDGLAGSSISKGDRCTVKNVKFEGGTGSEDQETDTEDFKI